MQFVYPESVRAVLNFAADRADGGRFSNMSPARTLQKHQPVEVDVRNVRSLSRLPTIDIEGFTVAAHSSGQADWSNKDWVEDNYVQSCVELIKTLTGAKAAFGLHGSAIIRRSDNGGPRGTMPAAHFVHLDNPRDSARMMFGPVAETNGVKLNRGAVFNIWKAISPPPQSVPLAVCDWRTVSERDHVIGHTVEEMPSFDAKPIDKNLEAFLNERATGDGGFEIPYVVLAHSEAAPKWYYVPDLTLDESLVFVGGDLDETHPLGCAHSAFVPPGPEANGEPRVSIEVRVLACFD